jgi:hypothetical protein
VGITSVHQRQLVSSPSSILVQLLTAQAAFFVGCLVGCDLVGQMVWSAATARTSYSHVRISDLVVFYAS